MASIKVTFLDVLDFSHSGVIKFNFLIFQILPNLKWYLGSTFFGVPD